MTDRKVQRISQPHSLLYGYYRNLFSTGFKTALLSSNVTVSAQGLLVPAVQMPSESTGPSRDSLEM